MNNFDKSLVLVLKHEGGYVNNPKDPGGPTNKGITLKTFRYAYGKERTEEELKNISDAQIKSLYHVAYWVPCGCPLLFDGVDYMMFDGAVNSGVSQSIKWLQDAIEAKVDGKMGPLTLAAVNKCSSEYLINHTLNNRLNMLRKLKTWDTFGKGWERRISEVRTGALKMSEESN